MYYLPKVAESKRSSLSEEEQERCDVLVRMIPGQNTKEIIAENVDGYLVFDETMDDVEEGNIHTTTSVTDIELSGFC